MRPLVWLALIASIGCADRDGDGRAGRGDCNDADPTVSRDALEVCDGVDNDCDGQIDEDVAIVAYLDRDRDGFGDAAMARRVCELPENGALEAGDCDETSPAIHPGADEICDQIDNDCDGELDEGVTREFYVDADGDGHGAGSAVGTAQDCWPPDGFAVAADDCDDADALRAPGAEERCNGLDDDCDLSIDEDLAVVQVFADADGDGGGDPDVWEAACGPGPDQTLDARDCDDTDPSIGPFADDVSGNGSDEDCDGWVDEYAVPSAWPTVADALAAAPDGAVVQFDDGLFLVNVDLRGRDVTLAGSGCEATVLYGQQSGSVVQMDGGALHGLTVMGGAGTAPAPGEPTRGGGLWVAGGRVVVRNVCFDMNSVSGSGGAIGTAAGSVLRVEDSRFTTNQAVIDGGAIAGDRSDIDVLRSTFVDNVAYDGRAGALSALGGRIRLQNVALAYNRDESANVGSTLNVRPWVDASEHPKHRVLGSLELDQVTLHGSGGTRSAVYVQGGPLVVRRSIFTDNEDDDGVLEIQSTVADFAEVVVPASIEVTDSGFARNLGPDAKNKLMYAHALREDPRYVSTDPDAVDLRLRPGSPFADLGPGLDVDGSLAQWGAHGGPHARPDALTPLADADGDGLNDGWELRHGLPTFFDDAAGDLDGDGLPNAGEEAADADPRVQDTDDDGVDDLTEITLGQDPTDPRDQVPVADVGGRRFGLIGLEASIAGTASFDPNEDPLTWAWTLQAPGGSLLTAVDDPTAPIATFTPDATGTYTLTLTVSDGLRSATHTTTLEATPGIRVPADVPTLEQALAEVASGEGIAVDPGIHPLSAYVGHKDVTVFGTGPGVVLQGDGESPVLVFEDGTLALADLTMQGGWNLGAGGCLEASEAELLQLTRVTVQDCEAGTLGGGVYALEMEVDAEDLVLRRNHAGDSGGGLGMIGVDLTIDGCEMSGNTASLGGAAIEHRRTVSLTVDPARVHGCTFSRNVGTSVVHLDGAAAMNLELSGSLAWRNEAVNTLLLDGAPSQSVLVTGHSLVFDDRLTGPAVVGSPFAAALLAVQEGKLPALIGNGGIDAGTRRTRADVRPAFAVAGQDPAFDVLFGRLGSSMHDQGWIDRQDADGSRADAGRAVLHPSQARWRLDVDADGMSDGWEVWAGLDPTVDDGASDVDGDGLSAYAEHEAGTHPTLADSDADGEGDGDELLAGLDPLDPADNRPTADAGPDQALTLADLVVLDGSGSSDPNGDVLTWAWTLLSVPAESSLTTGSLSDPATGTPSFVPDVRGTYRLSLVVSDGNAPSAADEVVVTVAGEIAVPADVASVDEAVAMVVPGDVVRVAAGVWPTRIEHDGVPFTLVGVSAQDTVLVGRPGARVAQITGGAHVTLQDLSLERGAALEGGGLRCANSRVDLERVIVRENIANQGAGLYTTGCEVNLVDTDLVRNHAQFEGGGAHFTGASVVTVLRGQVRENQASSHGAGIYLAGVADLTLDNTILAFNVTLGRGGALYRFALGAIVARHVSVIANEADETGGFYVNGGPLHVTDSLFAFNQGMQIFQVGAPVDTRVTTTGFWRPESTFFPTNPAALALTPASQNVLGNPGFAEFDAADPSGLDARLRPLSVMVDEGQDQDRDGSPGDLGAWGGPLAADGWDHWFTDADADGMSDRWEERVGLDPDANDADLDLDGDGLTNVQEYPLGLRPDLADTDGDGVDDLTEQTGPTDPRNPADHRPRAVPGVDVTVDPGVYVGFDGSGSVDPNLDPLTFAWSLAESPGRSALGTGDLTGADTAMVGLTPDAPGAYVLELVVHDGVVPSLPARVTVFATGDLDVPLDYPTVAQAMLAASSGATLSVGPGTFVAHLPAAGKPLVIQGSGVDQTVLAGSGFGRVVTVRSQPLTLRDLTLTGGFAPQGGGLWAEAVQPELERVHLVDNAAVVGGGMYVNAATVDLTRVRVADNHAAHQGAGVFIDNDGWVNASQVLFAGNRSSGSGGAAAVVGGTLIATNAVFADNHAVIRGGGLFTTGSQSLPSMVELGQVTATYNRAGSGGFLWGDYTDATVWNSAFVGSDAYTVVGPTLVGGQNALTWDARYTWVWQSAPGAYVLTALPSATQANTIADPRVIATDDGDWTNDTWLISPSALFVLDGGDPNSPADPDGSPAQPGAYGGTNGFWAAWLSPTP